MAEEKNTVIRNGKKQPGGASGSNPSGGNGNGDEHIIPGNLPVMPLRDVVVFPFMAMPLSVGRRKAIQLVDDALEGNSMFVAALQKAPETDDPGEGDVYRWGTIVSIVKMLRMPDDTMQMIVHGVARVKIKKFTQMDPYMRADIEPVEEPTAEEGDVEVEALALNLRKSFQRFAELAQNVPQEFVAMIMNIREPGRLADILSTIGNITLEDRQAALETPGLKKRLNLVSRLLTKTLEVVELGNRIQNQVNDEMGRTQRDYILREQLKALQKELGEKDEKTVEVEELKEKILKADMPEEALKAANRELDRLARMSPSAAEYTVSRTYLEMLTELPWKVSTQDNLDVNNVMKALDKDHYGLEKVKARVTEFMAVRKLKPDMKSPILCFVGPPGVGKTSLGMSIAKAMGRKFIRMSLGGVRDEAEIRGHRRTYIGALPGRIIQGVRKAGANNPVFMMDEVDKIGNDFRGDPASALLEVLDPEQNFSFSDHYIDVGFDLSKVMFIVTANMLDGIPNPLLDRMEVIELPGYTETEKLHIVKKFITPRQTRDHGLPARHIKFEDAAIRGIITGYTAEAGVRNVEREIAGICRKVAKEYSVGKTAKVTVNEGNLVKYLGKRKRHLNTAERVSIPGVAIGLAWTGVGGDILFIEASRMAGSKGLILTGKLGDVMKESAHAALTYVRASAQRFGIDEHFYAKSDIHIHIPAGAIPKDGPSAGVTLFTALYSLLTGKLVKSDLAMTGEISLRGQVLPVGGIREKVMAAHRSGIKTVLMPERNKDDLDDVPAEVKKALKFHFIKKLDDVIGLAFVNDVKGKGGVTKVKAKSKAKVKGKKV